VTYVVALVGLLVVLAGVIAYAGDRLGTWVGRRRLTLFGARPKRTGQIVGVAAGILIMLTTLGVLSVAFRSAAGILLNAQRTAEQLLELEGQERALQGQLQGLIAQQAALEADLRTARATIVAAESVRDEALADRDRLRAEAAETQAQLADLGEQLAAARGDLEQVVFDLAQAQIERGAALAEAAEARAGIAALEDEVAAAETALQAADVRLLLLDVQLSEADAALAAATELRLASEAAAAAAPAAAAAAEDARATSELARRAAEEGLAAAEEGLATAEGARLAAEAARDAAVAEREAAQARVDALVLRTDQLVAQVGDLEAEAAQLEAQAARLAAEATGLQHENTGLQARNDQLAQGNADLSGRNAALQELNASLQAEILAGNQAVRALQADVDELNDRLEDQARRLVEVQQEFSRAASGEITFARDQVVYSGALYASEPAEAREELAAFVRAASDHTARLGAGEVVLNAEQFAGLAEVIAETEGSDLVRFISPRNQFNPARVEVHVEALENTRLFDVGQLLMSRRIHVGAPELPATQEEVRGWIAQFKADVIRSLRRTGLDELQAPIFVGSSDEGFANQLMRLTGSVVIGVVAREAIDRAGPAYVELVILY